MAKEFSSKNIQRLFAEVQRTGVLHVGIAPEFYRSGKYHRCRVMMMSGDVVLLVSPDFARTLGGNMAKAPPGANIGQLARDLVAMADLAEETDRNPPTRDEAAEISAVNLARAGHSVH